MSDRIRLRATHFTKADPEGRVIKPIAKWPSGNQSVYDNFRQWLRDGGYGQSSLNIYSVSARLALGLWDKPYWQIDLQADLDQVRDYIETHYDKRDTRIAYLKGLAKLAEYLRTHRRQPRIPNQINWAYYLGTLPAWLAHDIQAYLPHRRRAWLAEQQHRATLDLLSHLTLFFRWLVTQTTLTDLTEITPQRWFAYVDIRLAKGIKPITLNGQLTCLQRFVQFLADAGRPICQRLMRVEPLRENRTLPRDVPLPQLRQLYAEILAEAAQPFPNLHRMGVMDRAWFLLMLHSGLRSGEVRRLRQAEVELTAGRVRIEQAKGLKDRLVYLSPLTVDALEAYLPLRGTADSDHLFLFRHRPLSVTYCASRLHTYSRRCNLQITPHQLRHSCATLLLNAGAPILTVQAILGHKHIDTTLSYARLYDGTVAADYYRAMSQIEPHLTLSEPASSQTPAHLVALLDSLQTSTLDQRQRETVQMIRAGLLLLEPDLVTDPITNTPEGTDD